MAQIGSFTKDDVGVYTGVIRTLALAVKASIHPVAKDSDKAPDYRVTAQGFELGAAWIRTGRETGAEYLAVKLDDPTFPAAVYATLMPADDGEHRLIWAR